ncbi:hypothetical protein [Methylobacterium sp. 1973]|uniref:hypothetical protein n=1 Tax=Methylobacterium sp. 1973 TaxID=3156421 RepID=UPI0033990BA0
MAKHTPGPWMATIGNRGTLCVISGDAWICGELSNGNGEFPGEAEANARLISAAPEMLEVLAEYLMLGAGKCTIGRQQADKALAVIRKATEAQS